MQEIIQSKAATVQPIQMRSSHYDRPEKPTTKPVKPAYSGFTRQELRRIVADQIN
jgi:hypothetical protein